MHTIDLYGEISDTKEALFSGNSGSFVVQAEHPSAYKNYALQKESVNRKQEKERYELLSLNIEEFSKKIRQEQVDDENYAAQGKKIGQLEETTVDGQKAYKFTLTKTFGGLLGGEALGPNVYQFTITESPFGDKFIIHYQIADITAERELRSFKFIK
ncbi:MAG: hypothetical protein ACYC8S_03115 [Minisyncoccota bacterium]